MESLINSRVVSVPLWIVSGATGHALLAVCHHAHVTEMLKLHFLIGVEINIYRVYLIGPLEAWMR